MVTNGDVSGYLISPDSGRVVYMADQQVDNQFELYSTPITGGGAEKVSGTIVPGGNVQAMLITPDSATVVFMADRQVDNVVELYSVPITGGATPLKLRLRLANTKLAPIRFARLRLATRRATSPRLLRSTSQYALPVTSRSWRVRRRRSTKE